MTGTIRALTETGSARLRQRVTEARRVTSCFVPVFIRGSDSHLVRTLEQLSLEQILGFDRHGKNVAWRLGFGWPHAVSRITCAHVLRCDRLYRVGIAGR